MSEPRRSHEFRVPGQEDVTITLPVQNSWEQLAPGETELEATGYVAVHMPTEVAGPFSDNIVVIVEELAADAPEDMERLQGVTYAHSFSSVPDFHAIDNRPLNIAGYEGWFRAALQTAPPGITAMSRQALIRLEDQRLVSILLTSMVLRDREASELFEDMVSSCTITVEGKEH